MFLDESGEKARVHPPVIVKQRLKLKLTVLWVSAFFRIVLLFLDHALVL